MRLVYKHGIVSMAGTDMVKHKATLFIMTNAGKRFKFKNSRMLGEDLGTTMYAERRQLQDILESVEEYLGDQITKEEMKYINEHFDDLFFNQELTFE